MNKDIVERRDIGFVDPRENSVYADKKYVEVNEAIKTILNASPTKVWDALQFLSEMKGANVELVVHGHWIAKREMIRSIYAKNYNCSICGAESFAYPNCPYCGAKNKFLDFNCVKCGKRLDLLPEKDGGKK